MEYFQQFSFSAARTIPGVQDARQSLHGHNFNLTLYSPQESPLLDGHHWDRFSQIESSIRPQLDYQHLNQSLSLESPDDGSILNWCDQKFKDMAIQKYALESQPNRTTILQSNQWYLSQSFILHAAHFLPHVPPGHKCGRLHGHNFKVIIKWALPSSEVLSHENKLQQQCDRILQELDKKRLNDFEGLSNPTSEILAAWLWHKVDSELPGHVEVTVYETATAGSTYSGKYWRCFKNFDLDSAFKVDDVLIGHSFRIRLRIQKAELDDHFGWTRDFGDIKAMFRPYFKQLDHQFLNEVEDLNSGELPEIAKWVARRLSDQLPELNEVRVWNTESTGVIHDL